jgi:hypothetical protein
MTVRSKSEKQIREFKDSFEKAFKTTLHVWRVESGNYVFSVGRRKYLKDFLKFSKITSDKDPLIPYEVLKYLDNTKAFLAVYLAFAGGSLNPALHRISITRVNQVKILKGLAIALHYEEINPIFSGN